MPPSCTKPCINEYSLERNGGVVITPPPIGKRSIVMSVSVCLSVCLSVREHVFGTTRPIFTKFFYLSHMAVTRSCSGGVAARY